MDDKIRAYVLKKEQQRERARKLREARKSESHLNKRSQTTHDIFGSHENKIDRMKQRRIIGDPFATRKTNTFGRDSRDSRDSRDEISDPTSKKRGWNSSTTLDNDSGFGDINSFSNTWNPNHNFDSRVSINKENWATQEDVKQVRGLVNQLQGQMHNLQYQIDTLKYENQRLKDRLSYFEQQRQSVSMSNTHTHTHSSGMTRDSRDSKMSRSQTQSQSMSIRNSRDPSPQRGPLHVQTHRNNVQVTKKPTAMDVDTPVNGRTKSRYDQSNGGMKAKFGGFGDETGNNGNGNGNGRGRFNNNTSGSNSNSNSFGNGQRRDPNSFSGSNSSSPPNRFGSSSSMNPNRGGFNAFSSSNRNGFDTSSSGIGSGMNSFDTDEGQNRGKTSNVGFSGFGNFSSNGNGNGSKRQSRTSSRSPEPMQMDDNDNDNEQDNENDSWNPPRSTANDLVKDLPPDAFQDNSSERIPCNICGRKFNHKALMKHSRICKKVFVNKRKTFDVSKQRLDEEAQRLQQTGKLMNARKSKFGKKTMAKQKTKSAWKNQSSSLREAIRAAREYQSAKEQGKDLSKLPMRKSNVPDNRVPCPYCGRKFSEEAASRHIPKCKNIKSRPKPLRRKR